ncbi:plastocyanin/azurin family copper-binding protein [Terrabacter sp. BE26]|uniref:cupredoxin domain-containing protein n=1 Tax=Terrabacter sp. BE26 TaxID=2898152 RepID=UPI0035BE2AF7
MSTTHLTHRIRFMVAAVSAAALSLFMLPAVSAQGTMTQTATSTHRDTRTWHVQVGEETAHQAIQGMAFLPGTVWINAGDRITWTANAGEIHTVTFLAKGQPLKPFDPFDPKQLRPRGGSHYDGESYYNSGIMSNAEAPLFPAWRTYTLTFDETGTFTYWCLVHGTMMKGVVHVRPAGTDYPFSQEQYDRRSARHAHRIFADGLRLWVATALQARNRTSYLGADDGVAMVMRFIRPVARIHVGQTVTWRNVGMAAPHTVTFGPERANIFAPYGDPSHFSGGQLNSGIVEPGGSFTVRFTKAGTYPYICALHDNLGMMGKVIVTGE